MGYRSEGALALRRGVYDRAMLHEIKLPALLESMDLINLRKDWVIWQYSGLKMYEDYPDVAEFNHFIESFNTGEWSDEILWARGETFTLKGEEVEFAPTECMEYVRIGEYDDDVETIGTQEILYVERSVGIY